MKTEHRLAPLSSSEEASGGFPSLAVKLPELDANPGNSTRVASGIELALPPTPEAKEIVLLRRTLKECESDPDHPWFSEVKEAHSSLSEDLGKAKASEECTMWGLPDVFTNLIGKWLLSTAKMLFAKPGRA